MKERLKLIIDNNPEGRFVFWCKTQDEQIQLKELLTELNYDCVVPLPGNFENMFNQSLPIGYMINIGRKDVSYNNSLEHWIEYTNDILEVKENGSIDWVF